jgi:hypothetical protein
MTTKSTFLDVLAAEQRQLDRRRRKLGRTKIEKDRAGKSEARYVGLALSGGGIRAAAFAIGAIDALSNIAPPRAGKTAASGSIFERVDYLSSVSGGSYAACSVVSTIATEGLRSPFGSCTHFSTEEYISSIRSRARLLSSRGWVDYFQILLLWLFGLVSGVLTILPFLLLISACFVMVLREQVTVTTLVSQYPGYLLIFFAVVFACYILFAVVYSSRSLRSFFSTIRLNWKIVFLFGFILLFITLQPVLIGANLRGGAVHSYLSSSRFQSILTTGLHEVLLAGGFLVVLVSLFLLFFLKRGQFLRTDPRNVWASVYRVAAQICLMLILVAAPAFLWSIVLTLSRWSVLCANCDKYSQEAPVFVSNLVRLLHDQLLPVYRDAGIESWFAVKRFEISPNNFAMLYVLLAVALYLFSKYCIDSNFTSFHRFYRDRIKNCFIPPRQRSRESPPASETNDDVIRMTATRDTLSPYLLVNCTINAVAPVDGETRVVDEPFVISSEYIGNNPVGYFPTALVEKIVGPEFDLATVAAISGAALSPVMGRYSIPAFRLLMSLLGFRLGYWIPNPGASRNSDVVPPVGRRVDGLYFLKEMFGTMTVRAPCLYITDGGHTDNSGVYELLRRRCATIIAVDAEADTEGLFDNVVYLIEQARVRLWTEIELSCRTVGSEGGTHCAIGEIRYPALPDADAFCGKLIYCKLSLTGDENLDLLSRKKASGEFPYNSTLNQNYDELTFNAYKVLGTHILGRVLSGEDDVEFCNGEVRQLSADELTELFKETS